MKNFSEMSVGANKALMSAALIAGLAGNVSESEAAVITLMDGTSHDINRIIFDVRNGIENGGFADTLINYDYDANGDPISSLGQLVLKTKPVLDFNSSVDDWVEKDVFDLSGSKFGELDAGIDWFSYTNEMGTNGIIETNLGTFNRAGSSVGTENISSAVPEPETLPLMLSGLATLFGFRRLSGKKPSKA